ncbi:hypothetical protein, partial [Floccifex sp.]|uniref:hypothetical protein n=1 Tax=Floccifex sp. TaxID=2815810 RepID=UPI003EFF532A
FIFFFSSIIFLIFNLMTLKIKDAFLSASKIQKVLQWKTLFFAHSNRNKKRGAVTPRICKNSTIRYSPFSDLHEYNQ